MLGKFQADPAFVCGICVLAFDPALQLDLDFLSLEIIPQRDDWETDLAHSEDAPCRITGDLQGFAAITASTFDQSERRGGCFHLLTLRQNKLPLALLLGEISYHPASRPVFSTPKETDPREALIAFESNDILRLGTRRLLE